MAKKESQRSDGIQAIGIMTPAGYHYKIAKEFLNRKIHVICDKPMTSSMEDAHRLVKAVSNSDAHFFLTHNY